MMTQYLILSLTFFTLSFASNLLPIGSLAEKFYISDLNNQRQGYKTYFTNQTPKDPKLNILSFWSTSCIPCRKEMPELEQIAEANPDIRLVFINLNTKNEIGKVKSFLGKFGIKGTVLLDQYQTTGKKYKVCKGSSCSVPALYGIDPQGKVVLAQTGYDPAKHDLKLIINNALAAAIKNSSVKTNVPEANNSVQANFQEDIQCEAAKSLKSNASKLAQKYSLPISLMKNQIINYIKTSCQDNF